MKWTKRLFLITFTIAFFVCRSTHSRYLVKYMFVMEHDSSLRNRSLTFDCGGSRIADSLHTRNFLRLPSLWGRLCVPLIHSDSRHLSVLRVESRLSRSSVLSIHSSQAFCISPSSRHIHTHRSSHSPSVPLYLPPSAPSLSLSRSLTRSSSPRYFHRSSLCFHSRYTHATFPLNPPSFAVSSCTWVTNEEASSSTSLFHHLSESDASNDETDLDEL